MNRDEADDARFEELMAREFPTGLVPVERSAEPAPGHDRPPSVSPSAPTEVPAADPRYDFRAWTPPEEPDEPFVPPPLPPARRWSAAGIAGTVLVVVPLLLVVIVAFGVRLPTLVAVLAGTAFFVGVVLLLHRLRQRPPIDGDGAVV